MMVDNTNKIYKCTVYHIHYQIQFWVGSKIKLRGGCRGKWGTYFEFLEEGMHSGYM
jgi:hypothetical protein